MGGFGGRLAELQRFLLDALQILGRRAGDLAHPLDLLFKVGATADQAFESLDQGRDAEPAEQEASEIRQGAPEPLESSLGTSGLFARFLGFPARLVES